MNTAQIDRTITDWLSGRHVDWAKFRYPDACLALTQRLDMHGIAACLPAEEAIPPQIAQHVARCRATQAFWEAEHREIVADIVELLHRSGIDSLVIKGTALAYSVYSEPSYRSRSDTDLVIRTRDRKAAEQILRDQGFTHHKGVELDVSRGQQGWQKAAAMGAHVIDLH